jgi:excinuclease ABC subunit B
MSGFKLTSKYKPLGDQPKAIDFLVKGLKNNHRDQALLGITGSGKTFTIANVIQKVQKPTLILSHNKTLAAQLYGEFKSLFPDNAVEYFISYYDYYQPEAYMPVTDTYIEKDSSINAEIDKLRIKSSTSLVSRNDVIVIASVSCIYGVGSPKEYSDSLISVKKNKVIAPKELFKSLVDIHYIRNDMILEGGIFRVRGDIVDIFPIYDEHPIRLEFFGNEIEKISIFDLITGEIIKEINQVTFYPCKNFVTSRETINKGIKLIKKELFDRLKFLRSEGSLLEAQRLEQRTFYDIEMMLELGYCSGIENYSRHLDGRKKGERPYCLLDFFPDDFLMIIDESHVSIPQVRAMYNGDRSRKENLVEHGFRLPSALDNRPMKFDEFEEKINQVIYVSATPAEYETLLSENNIIEQIIRPTGLLDPKIEVHKTKGQIDFLIENIKQVVRRKERALVTTITKKSAEDLTDYLNSMGLKCQYMHSGIDTIERVKILRGLRLKHFDVLIGINLLREGLDLPEVSLVAVIDADKQGFLRSKSSLIQVAGRAARNINGRVILFGDVITDPMKYLIDQTDSRRKIQADYNKKNNITPKTILKNIDEIKSTTVVADKDIEEIINDDIEIQINNLDSIELKDKVEEIERRMLNYAKELQFEKAALLRDQLDKLKNNKPLNHNV